MDSGQQDLAARNVALANRLAWSFWERSYGQVPLDDLRGEALWALSYAADRFEHRRGVPFGAYATMAIKHRLIQIVQRPRPPLSTCMGDFDAEPVCPETREPGQLAATAEGIDQLRRRLPARWYEALHMRHVEGMTYDEIGQRLNVTRERVRQILLRATDYARGVCRGL